MPSPEEDSAQQSSNPKKSTADAVAILGASLHFLSRAWIVCPQRLMQIFKLFLNNVEEKIKYVYWKSIYNSNIIFIYMICYREFCFTSKQCESLVRDRKVVK